MFITERLFDEDSHRYDFTATVLSCTQEQETGLWLVTLDKTAFFPEGGGQSADEGTLNSLPVVNVQVDKRGLITHTVTAPFLCGESVSGHIDRDTRLERMQCHSGEHIISGIICRRYGFDNVGFHLGADDVTLDFNGVLTRAQLDEVEDEANRIVRLCVPIRAYYPSPAELATLSYRSKLALTEDIRIVRIGTEEETYDLCACCAPHVANTGEVGIIKLLDFIHYKGGIRIHMTAGARAVRDYRERYKAVARISSALSVKQADVLSGFERLTAQAEDDKARMTALRREVQDLKVASLPVTDGNLCLFDDGLDALAMRNLLNRAVTKCGGICGVFSGNDTNGYTYVIGRARDTLDLTRYAVDIRTALSAKGGGSAEMIQGRAQASRAVIEAFFMNFTT